MTCSRSYLFIRSHPACSSSGLSNRLWAKVEEAVRSTHLPGLAPLGVCVCRGGGSGSLWFWNAFYKEAFSATQRISVV